MPPRHVSKKAVAAAAAAAAADGSDGSKRKKKGMTMEEKVAKVEAWCRGHVCPYTLKELQTLVPRATGVLYQSIDECVELLVAEGRLQQARIGVHTLHWCFPRTAWQRAHDVTTTTGARANNSSGNRSGSIIDDRRAMTALCALSHEALQQHVAQLRRREAAMDAAMAQRLAALHEGNDDNDNNNNNNNDTAALRALTLARVQLCARVDELRVHDPALRQALHRATACACAAWQRWADGYARLESCVAQRLRVSPSALRAALQMPAALADELPTCVAAAAADDNNDNNDGDDDDSGGRDVCDYPLPTLVRASSLLVRDAAKATTEAAAACTACSDEHDSAHAAATLQTPCTDEAAAATVKTTDEAAAAAVIVLISDDDDDAAGDKAAAQAVTTTTTKTTKQRRKRARRW